jgi:hypothetical protein
MTESALEELFAKQAAPWEPIPDDGLPRHPESRRARGV